MEGLSGQSDPNTFRFQHRERYEEGRILLTDDVNAVIAGLFDGGATVVHVVDAHGSGNPEPDLLVDRLDPRAQRVTRDRPFRRYVDLVADGGFDAIAVVGMHAKTGSGGFASHTFTLGMDIIMNGASLTETELIALAWGRAGVPVIFASGDDRLAADLVTMPWLEYVTVKTATSASGADLLPLEQARAALRAGAARALERRADWRSMRLVEPAVAALRAVPPASLTVLNEVPGIALAEDRVEFPAVDFQAAYDGVIALIRVARTAYPSVLTETVRAEPGGEAIMDRYNDNLFARWLDFESGRWTPPPAAPPVPGRVYHGAN
jgi:D-amino peptidase